MLDIKTIIVPIDFSRLSLSALEYAKNLAERVDATIHIIYVMDKNPPFIQSKSDESTKEEMLKSIERDSLCQLEDAVNQLGEDSLITVKKVLRSGIDYEEIVKYTMEVNGDLIVIATHGRTGVLHTLLGSVTEKVIRYSKCPVLVISPKDEEQ
jgi:nucleotide-binding universal stress UspA family protein